MTIQSDGWQFHAKLVHLYRDAMKVVERQTGMSQTRLDILHELFHADEISQAELQNRLDIEGAVATRILKQLEAAGMVSRRPDPQDNRFTLVSMSKEMRSSQNDGENMRFKDNYGERIMQGINAADRAHLLRMIEQIQENILAIGDTNLIE
ncbi:MAG: MarR family transcriptional regulator [Chloroflexota bacterium]